MTIHETQTIKLNDAHVETRLKKAVERVYDLPSFPLVIRKLMEVAEDPRSSSKDLARVMESDQGLSTKVLKLVNSAFYSFPNPVSSLQHAITLVGYNSVRSLAMSVSVKTLFKTSGSFSQQRFWEHSLATALAARILAEINRYPLKDDLFTAGLLHDIGVLLEARYFPEELERSVIASRIEGTSLSEAENRFLSVDHCLLGSWLGEKWRLPQALREGMLRHHEFENPELAAGDHGLSEDLALVVRIVTLGNLIARGMGYTHERGEGPELTEISTDFEIPDHLVPYLQGQTLEAVATRVHESFHDCKEFLTV